MRWQAILETTPNDITNIGGPFLPDNVGNDFVTINNFELVVVVVGGGGRNW